MRALRACSTRAWRLFRACLQCGEQPSIGRPFGASGKSPRQLMVKPHSLRPGTLLGKAPGTYPSRCCGFLVAVVATVVGSAQRRNQDRGDLLVDAGIFVISACSINAAPVVAVHGWSRIYVVGDRLGRAPQATSHLHRAVSPASHLMFMEIERRLWDGCPIAVDPVIFWLNWSHEARTAPIKMPGCADLPCAAHASRRALK